MPLCGFFSPLWLEVTHCNFPKLPWEAACLSGMLVLLLFVSEGEWWVSTCLAYPKSGCRDRQCCGAAVPSQEIVLGQPWLWGAVGRDAAVVVGLLVLREPKERAKCFTGFVLLCSPLLPVNALLWQAGMFRKKHLELLGEKKAISAIDLNGNNSCWREVKAMVRHV